jgi:hypothetical protein
MAAMDPFLAAKLPGQLLGKGVTFAKPSEEEAAPSIAAMDITASEARRSTTIPSYLVQIAELIAVQHLYIDRL